MAQALAMIPLHGKIWLMERVAKLYCQIFQEEPWKENFTEEEITAIMIEQLNRPSAIALAALKEDEVVGFTWMYEIFAENLQEDTRYSPKLKFLFEPGSRLFYFQEVGVKKEYRRQGIGEKLTREILLKGKGLGMNIAVLSTNQEALPALKMFSKIGFENSKIIRPGKESRTYWILK